MVLLLLDRLHDSLNVLVHNKGVKRHAMLVLLALTELLLVYVVPRITSTKLGVVADWLLALHLLPVA